MNPEFNRLYFALITIRKLAYENKNEAKEKIGMTAQSELMEIERIADILVARLLQEAGSSFDPGKLKGKKQ